jgi:hypothetical protein
MSKKWTSPTYAFFDSPPAAYEVDGRECHIFSCLKCKDKFRRFLDTKDANSMSNLCKHVKNCWGEDALQAAEDIKKLDLAREKVVRPFLKNGSITTAFRWKGSRKVTYSTKPYTKIEVQLVSLLFKY